MSASPSQQAEERVGRFISLKWKTMLLVSVALAGVHIGLVTQAYRDALDQFKERQAHTFEQRTGVLRRLLEQSDARLQRVAAVVSDVLGVATPGQEMEDRWGAVQLELALEVMQLYGPDGRVRVRGLPSWGDTPPAELLAQVHAGLHAERPRGFILCRPDCIQYALVPMLGKQGDRQLMVLGTSLADVVLEFPGLAGADVAVLVATPAAAVGSYWGRYLLPAMSAAPENEPKVRALSGEKDLARLQQGGDLNFRGRSYRFYAQPLREFHSLTEGYFLIFGDTTEALADIRSQIRRQLGIGLSAMLAALLLLLAILNRPMTQLRNLAQALPLLARREYGPARRLIGSTPLAWLSHTEIEMLERVAVDLSHKLEALEQTVAARNRSLAERLDELKRAHELNDKIFATAPMVILIQSGEGKVLNMNEFGSQLLGYSAAEAQGMTYLSLLADPRQREEVASALVDLISGRRPLFEQTGPLRCVDGSLERITWLHTRLTAQSGTFVLSVGLPDRAQVVEQPTGT